MLIGVDRRDNFLKSIPKCQSLLDPPNGRQAIRSFARNTVDAVWTNRHLMTRFCCVIKRQPNLSGRYQSNSWDPAMGRRSSTSTNLASTKATRRDFLYIATATVGAVGAAADVNPADRPDEPGCWNNCGGSSDRLRLKQGRARSAGCSALARKTCLYHQSHTSNSSNPSKP